MGATPWRFKSSHPHLRSEQGVGRKPAIGRTRNGHKRLSDHVRIRLSSTNVDLEWDEYQALVEKVQARADGTEAARA